MRVKVAQSTGFVCGIGFCHAAVRLHCIYLHDSYPPIPFSTDGGRDQTGKPMVEQLADSRRQVVHSGRLSIGSCPASPTPLSSLVVVSLQKISTAHVYFRIQLQVTVCEGSAARLLLYHHRRRVAGEPPVLGLLASARSREMVGQARWVHRSIRRLFVNIFSRACF